jgi:predicted alpha/beta hydrolase family esterase
MKQVCIIHGGSTFETEQQYLESLQRMELKYIRMLYGRRWKYWLGETLTDYEVILPEMPNKSFAKYEEWALFFSKVVRFLKPDAVLVGHSLGGIFLAKYLNEHPELHFHKVAFVAAPFDEASTESLASFALPNDLTTLGQAGDMVGVFQSKDDKVVPFDEAAKYAKVLTNSTIYEFDDRGHFNQETFPELLEFIKK